MKYYLAIVLFLTSVTSFSQEEKGLYFTGKIGYGYFTDLFGVFKKDIGAKHGSEPGQRGNMLWSEVQIHLNQKTAIGFLFGRGQVGFTKYDVPFRENTLVKPYRIDDLYEIYSLSFYKIFSPGKSHFSFGVGPQYMRMKSPQLGYKMVPTTVNGEYGQTYSDFTVEYSKEEMIGLAIDLDYSYSLYRNLSLGIKTNTSVMAYYGLEGLLISPYLKFGF